MRDEDSPEVDHLWVYIEEVALAPPLLGSLPGDHVDLALEVFLLFHVSVVAGRGAVLRGGLGQVEAAYRLRIQDRDCQTAVCRMLLHLVPVDVVEVSRQRSLSLLARRPRSRARATWAIACPAPIRPSSWVLRIRSLRGELAGHVLALEVFLDGRNMVVQELIVEVIEVLSLVAVLGLAGGLRL